MSHPSLSPNEAERLEMLAEEAGEVVQAVTKILRHGYESYHPQAPAASNRKMLNTELGDLIAVHVLMMTEGDLPEIPVAEIPPRIRSKLHFTHHQRIPPEMVRARAEADALEASL